MGSGERTLFERLVCGISLHAEAIADIASRGEISVVLLTPSEGWREALATHGWRGQPVFPMSRGMRLAMSCSDEVTESWIERSRLGISRIFAVIDDESLLVNSEQGLLGIEPGSMEEAR
jgi:hypothetical protein